MRCCTASSISGSGSGSGSVSPVDTENGLPQLKHNGGETGHALSAESTAGESAGESSSSQSVESDELQLIKQLEQIEDDLDDMDTDRVLELIQASSRAPLDEVAFARVQDIAGSFMCTKSHQTIALLLDKLELADTRLLTRCLNSRSVALCKHDRGSQAMRLFLGMELKRLELIEEIRDLVAVLINSFVTLVLDPYGHQVLEAVVALGSLPIRDQAAEALLKNRSFLLQICLDELGSKVVAVVLQQCSPRHAMALCKQLLREDASTLAYGPSLDVLWALLESPDAGPKAKAQLLADPGGLMLHENGHDLAKAFGIPMQELREGCLGGKLGDTPA